jgi:hypothetical protein
MALTPASHANAHCIMKVLKGQLTETRYHWPTVQLNNGEHGPLQIEAKATYEENEVTYMSDKLGLHKISNPHPTKFAVSLHCTAPWFIGKTEVLIRRSIHPSECGGIWLPYLR